MMGTELQVPPWSWVGSKRKMGAPVRSVDKQAKWWEELA